MVNDEDFRHIPEQTPRVETGPTVFGDDWPGVFIRGDNAMFFGMTLEHFLNGQSEHELIAKSVLRGLVEVLKSCRMGG